MQSRKLKAWALASTLLTGVGVGAPALAQDAEEADEGERIVVTGTRLLANPNLAAATPVLSVGDEELDARGNIRIEDFINILPQVFAGQAGEVSNGATGTATLNLRGLGTNRTLVLIDGRRLPYGASYISAPNLDLIPSQLVERVDILTGGASAVYGSDAVSGVANFILKRDFEGVEFDVQTGIAHNGNDQEPWDSVLEAANQPVPDASWDGEEYFLTLTMGANTPDGRGNVTLFATYEDRNEISQADRSISGCALGQATGANSFAGYGCVGSFNFRGFGGSGGFGFQQEDGTIVPGVGGPAQTFNFGPFNYFQRPSERFQMHARGHYAITDTVEAFADLSYTVNNTDAQIAPSASFGSWDINCDNPLIQNTPGLQLTDLFGCSASDIANGVIKQNVFASHRNVEGDPRISRLENSAYRAIAGLRGTLQQHWNWEAFIQYSETDDLGISENDLVVSKVQQSFLVEDDGMGNPVCIDPSGGCVPWNIFQRGPNGESLAGPGSDWVAGVGLTSGETSQLVYGADIQADLGNYGISSPWSDAGVAVLFGGEYREDELVSIPDEISQIPGGGFTGVGGATLPVAGSVEVSEAFSEVQVPIATNQSFADELTLSGQYRFSRYEASGNNVTNTFETDAYGVQLAWAPISDLRLRAQYQRAVRAPNVIEMFTGLNTGLPNLSSAGTNSNGVQLFDPCASAAPIASLAACQNTGVTAAQYGTILDVISGQTQAITGGEPTLDPEVADTYTFGVVFTPQQVPGLSVSVDYFDITVEDAVAPGIPAQNTLDQCLATGDPLFCDLIDRGPGGTLAAGFGNTYGFNQINRNIAELQTSGVDVQVNYRLDLADMPMGLSVENMGAIRFDYAATFLDQLDTIQAPGLAPIKCAGFFGNQCGAPNPEYRHRLVATWETPWAWDGGATWRWFGGTDNDNTNDMLETDLPGIGYLDLQGNYQVTDNVRVRGGVLNVLNNQAPVFTSAGPPLGNGNTYPTVYDTGRFFFAAVTLAY